MGNVIKFYPNDAAKDPDAVLEQAVGVYETVLILGWDKDGNLDARGDLRLTRERAVFLVEYFKHYVMFPDGEE